MSEPHKRWMRVALELARKGIGLTRPNPPVGAVVVKKGRVIGSGWHRRAGTPHAEIHALREAGRRAHGATLYITLEPCSTWGRTPPCTDAILASGVRELVVATRDPNPKHAGRGLRILKRAGIQVSAGVLESEARAMLRPFEKWITTGRPFITLKMGMTCDGRIADRRRQSKWITGAQSRARVQELRRAADAILVGARTAIEDDPSLLPRPARGREPLRVIVSRGRRLPRNLKALSDEASGQTIIFKGRPLPRVLAELGRRGVLHVLCEGGGELASALIRAGLVDEYVLFVAPIFLGGTGVPVIGGAGWNLNQAPRARWEVVEPCGSDIMLRGRPA